jgi:hypothetical protein
MEERKYTREKRENWKREIFEISLNLTNKTHEKHKCNHLIIPDHYNHWFRDDSVETHGRASLQLRQY